MVLFSCNKTEVSEEQKKRFTELKTCLQDNQEITSLMLSGSDSTLVNYDDIFALNLEEYVQKHKLEATAIDPLLADLDLMCMSVNSYQMIEQDNADQEEESPLP